MKNKILNLILVLGIVFFTDCSSDDKTSQTESLYGTWKLKNISGGFAGINDDYAPGEVTWTFNEQNLTLSVENNSSQQNIFSGLENGTYNYTVIANNGSEYLLIGNDEYGETLYSMSTLTINQNKTTTGSGNDGFLLVFER